jgi:hypothetical protein
MGLRGYSKPALFGVVIVAAVIAGLFAFGALSVKIGSGSNSYIIGNPNSAQFYQGKEFFGNNVEYDYHNVVCPTITYAPGHPVDIASLAGATVTELPNGAHEVQLQCKPNLFTTIGQNITRDDLDGLQADGAATVIGLGNDTLVGADSNATNAELPGFLWTNCGLQKATGTAAVTAAQSGNWTVTEAFTNTCANSIVNETGLYNSTSNSNALFAENTFPTATLQNGDQITITWYLWVA